MFVIVRNNYNLKGLEIMLKKLFSYLNSEERKRQRLYEFYKGQKPPKSPELRNLFIFYRVTGKVISTVAATLFSTILIFILILTIVGTITLVYLLTFTNDVKPIELRDKHGNYSTSIYTMNSQTNEYELAYKITPSTSNVYIKTNISDLPDYVKYSFVSVEDERFFVHEGVDYKRTAAAVMSVALSYLNLRDSYFGGSTITQQLIKNVTGNSEDTWERKMREIFTAMKLEKRYTKDQILESYLNEIYFDEIDGYNMYGIEAASIGYFGKPASELTIAEAATLAAIPKSPNDLNPSKNYKENKVRREYCLEKMFKLGVISCDQYEEALNEKVLITNMKKFRELHPDYQKFSNEDETFENPNVNSDALDLAIMEFADYIINTSNIKTTKEAIEKFKSGGYTLYLSVDNDIQSYLEDRYSDWYWYFPQALSNENEKVQSACVVMDYSGLIRGIIGRIGEKESSLTWNNAYIAHRQCGSTIKPLTSYGYALENDKITWSTMFEDKALPAGIAAVDEWPNNYDGAPKGGTHTVSYFLKRSINTLPAQLCHTYSLKSIFDFATNNMHLDLDKNSDITYSSLAIGGTSTGPTLLNLTNSYIPYGNGGLYYEASIISKAIDVSTGEVIIDNENREGERAVHAETAFVMNKLLQNNVNGENGTGAQARLKNKEIGGKTGTTENWRDIDFIGLTPDFVSGVWIGYEDGSNPEAIENSNSALVWYNVFGKFADSYESTKSFPKCGTVIYSRYCSETGMLATDKCPGTEYGYYKSTNCAFCNVHGTPEPEGTTQVQKPVETQPVITEPINGLPVLKEPPTVTIKEASTAKPSVSTSITKKPVR